MNNNITFYNTSSKKLEPFVTNEPNIVKMYTCGPTVYHYAHIGNLRSYLMEDILEKFLSFAGYDVNRVMNITDVGHLTSDSDEGPDKMVEGAKREKKTVLEIAKYYTDAFFNDCAKLNIKKPDTVENATDCVHDYIEMITNLIDKNFAYLAGGNIYFDTSKLNNYYVLTGHSAENLEEAVRKDVSVDENKRNKTDFVLWFTKSKFDDQDLKWESPWGLGYPGWHIECSCISMKHLGNKLDIHCGGIDNIFPHHTNEIAQSEALLGHKWCNYWFHVHHLTMKDSKMSKSAGEFLTLSLLEDKGYLPLAYRFFCLQSHYRKPLEFSYEILQNATIAYKKLRNKVSTLDKSSSVDSNVFSDYKSMFIDALSDDLNTARALSILYDVLKANISESTKYAIIKDFDDVLGLDLTTELLDTRKISEEMEDYINQMIKNRIEAKASKDYTKADEIRNELLSKGITLKDTKDGTTWGIENN